MVLAHHLVRDKDEAADCRPFDGRSACNLKFKLLFESLDGHMATIGRHARLSSILRITSWNKVRLEGMAGM